MDIDAALSVAQTNLDIVRVTPSTASDARLSELMTETQSLAAELAEILAFSRESDKIRAAAGKLDAYAMVLYPEVRAEVFVALPDPNP